MVELQAELGEKGLQIVCFPCNQFGKQEPKECPEIVKFVQARSDEGFGGLKMMEKIEVNGPDAHPLYKWMKKEGGITDIKWNFGSYFLFDKDGYFKEMLTGVPRKMVDPIRDVCTGATADKENDASSAAPAKANVKKTVAKPKNKTGGKGAAKAAAAKKK